MPNKEAENKKDDIMTKTYSHPGFSGSTDGQDSNRIWNYWESNKYVNGVRANLSASNARRVFIVQFPESGIDKDNGGYNEDAIKQLIQDNLYVSGFMTNEVNYSISAKWAPSNGIISSVAVGIGEAIGNKTGVVVGASGYKTRKYYSAEGSDLKLTINFRIYALSTTQQDGTRPDLARQLLLLKKMVLPRKQTSFEVKDLQPVVNTLNTIEKLGEEMSSDKKRTSVTQDDLKSARPGMSETALQMARAMGNLAEGVKQTLGKVASGYASDMKSADITVNNAPEPVYINIGGWLVIPEAVVESINFTYSKAVNKLGPLYCDVQMGITTRENLEINTNPTEENDPLVQLGLFEANNYSIKALEAEEKE